MLWSAFPWEVVYALSPYFYLEVSSVGGLKLDPFKKLIPIRKLNLKNLPRAGLTQAGCSGPETQEVMQVWAEQEAESGQCRGSAAPCSAVEVCLRVWGGSLYLCSLATALSRVWIASFRPLSTGLSSSASKSSQNPVHRSKCLCSVCELPAEYLSSFSVLTPQPTLAPLPLLEKAYSSSFSVGHLHCGLQG